MVTNWFAPKPTDSAQDYGRALLRTKRLHQLARQVTELDALTSARERAAFLAAEAERITFESLRHSGDTRLTLKEVVTFHPLTIAQIAACAGLVPAHLSMFILCHSVPTPVERKRIAAALDMAPDAIRWPAYRAAQEVA